MNLDFAEYLSESEHLARLKFADLFLDTFRFSDLCIFSCFPCLWDNHNFQTKIGENRCRCTHFVGRRRRTRARLRRYSAQPHTHVTRSPYAVVLSSDLEVLGGLEGLLLGGCLYTPRGQRPRWIRSVSVSYTHLRAHET